MSTNGSIGFPVVLSNDVAVSEDMEVRPLRVCEVEDKRCGGPPTTNFTAVAAVCDGRVSTFTWRHVIPRAGDRTSKAGGPYLVFITSRRCRADFTRTANDEIVRAMTARRKTS